MTTDILTPASRAARSRKAAGPGRSAYLDHADVDRVMAIVLALISEVASLRSRLDTHERLAARDLPSTVDGVEGYLPDDRTEAEREAWRDAYIRRLFRVITEDVEALKTTTAGTDASSTVATTTGDGDT